MALIVILGLTVGNVVAQAVGDNDWGTAAERSFFQAIAIALYALMARAERRVAS